ncbi:MAG: TIGR03905 family TSCPD domain-containing protein [Lachnospiraceae bacterium]|nr:TIGR03905 family TSCPD domain-containing protein [Lachnospiraceae bacterium]MBP5533086.1 TIGR03905 family TSCPD domain-containing protein [Lachnospiraceae bacterium]MBR4776810.1 TIGR03905 family TSCPD domain-containing protein [Lachnospiraceae bacterium]MBR4816518.1 TIGR03905 family TSCPD domain-containing protein [Lachnospiraceae bacterium]
MYEYKTTGTCSTKILFDIYEEDGVKKVKDVQFVGGCHGNTQGVAKLVEGMRADEVIDRLKGIKCGFKPTSCPDQLAKAIESQLR